MDILDLDVLWDCFAVLVHVANAHSLINALHIHRGQLNKVITCCARTNPDNLLRLLPCALPPLWLENMSPQRKSGGSIRSLACILVRMTARTGFATKDVSRLLLFSEKPAMQHFICSGVPLLKSNFVLFPLPLLPLSPSPTFLSATLAGALWDSRVLQLAIY